ncbi:nucleotidyltransferase domain-containing protein [Amycolatopsis sp. VS8301801F10]|uniref:nucleotidyltransferase domain-containing protein n=1 Tax=Amycolatopsis sp. VS8301801F10 TaxID=2652442 RepID=UPI0038FCF219
MTSIRFPTPLHRRVLQDIVAELGAEPGVRGVVLGGSAARGTARVDSDLDVLVVTVAPDHVASWRSRARPVPVDFLAYTANQWRKRFAPDRVGDESWGYAFLDGVIVYDPEGVIARLVASVAEIHARYRVPASIKTHYASLWHHVRPKMLDVLRRDDPIEIGWAAAVMTDDLLRTAWAVNDLPNPSLDLGTVQRHLGDLTVPADVSSRIRAILRAAPKEALRLQLELVTVLETHLGSLRISGECPNT